MQKNLWKLFGVTFSDAPFFGCSIFRCSIFGVPFLLSKYIQDFFNTNLDKKWFNQKSKFRKRFKNQLKHSNFSTKILKHKKYISYFVEISRCNISQPFVFVTLFMRTIRKILQKSILKVQR